MKLNGKYRWFVFFTIAFSYFMVFSQRTAPGLITDTLMQQFDIAASTLGVLTGIQYLAYMSLQVPLGIWADRFGPNKFLVLGTFLDGIGTIAYSMAPNAAILMAARLFVGIGDAMIWINLVLVLSQWFRPEEFASLLGWTGMSGSLGAILTTVPLSIWIADSGWRIPFFSLGVVLLGCSLLIYLVLVRGPKQQPVHTAKLSNEQIKQSQQREKTSLVLSRLVRERHAWGTFLCHFGLVGTYIGFIGSWAVPYGMTVYGMSRMTGSEMVSLGLIGSVVGGPITGLVCDRIGSYKRPYMVIHALTFLCWLFIIVMGGRPPILLLMVLYVLIGYGNGSSMLTFAIIRKTYSLSEIGVASGFANTGGFLSAVTLPFLFGSILDYFENHLHTAANFQQTGYQFGFAIPALFSLAGLIGSTMITENKSKSKSMVQSASAVQVSMSK